MALLARRPERPGEVALAAWLSPILSRLTERSRCHPALLGSGGARRSKMALARLVGAERPGEVALGGLAVADLVQAHRESRAIGVARSAAARRSAMAKSSS